jgi:hypothetical protein
LDVSAGISLAGSTAKINMAETVEAYAGTKASLSTQDIEVQVDGNVNAFAGDTASITTTDLNIGVLGEMKVQTTYARIDATKGVKLSSASVDVTSADTMTIGASELGLSVAESMSVGTGGATSLHAGGAIALATNAGMSAQVAEELEVFAGSATLQLSGPSGAFKRP